MPIPGRPTRSCGRKRPARSLRGGPLALLLAAAIGPPAPADTRGSIRDGVYTSAQAERGAAVYPSACGRCHGAGLDGAPDDPDMLPATPIAGPKFLRKWDGRTLAALYAYTKAAMPSNNPGFLLDGEYADLIAYMLAESGAPAGDVPLPADASRLGAIAIVQGPLRTR